MKKALLSFGLLIAAVSITMAENWTHWRGPSMDGSSATAKPPIKWDANTNIAWKVPVPGAGSATPIVWENKVFVVSAVKTDKMKEVAAQPPQEQPQEEGRGRRGGRGGGQAPTNYYEFKVMCFDLNTGNEIWSKIATELVPHAGHHPTNTYASGSPITDGERLYVTFGSMGIFCYDLDGNKLWEKDFGDMNTAGGFGEGTSLNVDGDNLIVVWDHQGDSFITNLNAKTGDEKWKMNRDESSTWGTPFITNYDGKTQIVTTGTNKVRSYDMESGDVIWECGGLTSNPIPTPFRYQDNVFCTSGYRGNAFLSIPLNAKGDITGSDKITWSYNQDTPYVPSPTLYQDQVYFLKSRDDILTSLNAKDGSVVYAQQRLNIRGGVYSSPGAANGHIYISSREGDTAVLKAGNTFEIVATNQLGEGIDASPVFIGNKLLLRGANNLYCIAEK